ncbi:MAG: hypothetical protein U0270_03775 [Labilithrix sp.]
MRFLLAVVFLALPACTISYYGQEETGTDSAPTEPALGDAADAAISTG